MLSKVVLCCRGCFDFEKERRFVGADFRATGKRWERYGQSVGLDEPFGVKGRGKSLFNDIER